ncbi:hypothetical protein B0J14DRAFT_155469 [Halenospora varia]|nr:hypothetical protein B0J14DRAFT_155469 [Halenospora varia]
MSTNSSPSGHSPQGQARRSQGPEEEETALPIVACRRCRKQKLRCSRELPACKRCTDLSTVCDYPPPPDRKLLAAQRWQNAKARAHRDAVNAQAAPTQQKLPVLERNMSAPFAIPATQLEHRPSIHTPPDIPNDHHHTAPHGQNGLQNAIAPIVSSFNRCQLPSPELADFLIEMYFSHLMNSTLMFHKKTFLADYAARKTPESMNLSIFALATIFLRESDGPPRRDLDANTPNLGTLPWSAADLVEQGYEWATAATYLALAQIDHVRIENVQTCQNLTLYWFSVGEVGRTDIHSCECCSSWCTSATYCHPDLAWRTAQQLELNVEKKPYEELNDEERLIRELERRCFWAAWVGNVIDQSANARGGFAWSQVSGLLLPSDEESYAAGKPRSTNSFDDNGILKPTKLENDVIRLSPFAGLVNLFSLWVEIRVFTKLYEPSDPKRVPEMMSAFFELDAKLGLAIDHLDPSIRHSNVAAFKSPKVNPHLLFWLHGLYRLCACTLHSFFVPLFSNIPPHSLVSRKLVRISAEEVVKHAALTLDMATAFLSTKPDISRLPSTTGYSLYVAVTLHFKSLVAQRKVGSSHMGRLRAALLIIERLKLYWNTVQGLWKNLSTLISEARIPGLDIDTICGNEMFPHPGMDDQPPDIERIVASKESPKDGNATDFSHFTANKVPPLIVSRRRSVAEGQPPTNGQSPTPALNATKVQIDAAKRSRTLSDAVIAGTSSQNQAGLQAYTQMLSQPSSMQTQQPSSWQNCGVSNGGAHASGLLQTSGSMSNNFQPLSTVNENSDMRTQQSTSSFDPNGMRPGSVQNYDVYGNDMRDIMGMEMDIDQMNFWWDQSYMPFDANVEHQLDPNADPAGNPYGQHFYQ